MFDQPVYPLLYEPSITSSMCSFDEIPIWMPRYPQGYGDVMATVKLAEGLKREFPDKDVCVYFDGDESYEKLGKLFQGFDPKQKRQRLNGISAAHLNEKQIKEVMARSLVGIYSPVIIGYSVMKDDFFIPARLNFYIEEYDSAGFNSSKPLGTLENQLMEDQSGNKHLILPTGFELGSRGIHIDPKLVALDTTPTRAIKRDLLSRLNFLDMSLTLRDVLDYEWTVAYYHEHGDFRINERKRTYLSALKDALIKTRQTDKKIIVFDFSPLKNQKYLVEGHYHRDPFNDVFEEQGRKSKLIPSSSKNEEMTFPNVYIAHVGPHEHSVFLDFMRYAELPVAITGDVSLAEAVALRKPFLYCDPGWKVRMATNRLSSLTLLLDDLNDAERMTQTFGFRREAVEFSLGELEDFYLKHRDTMRLILARHQESIIKRKRTSELELFGNAMDEQKIPEREWILKMDLLGEDMFELVSCSDKERELEQLRKAYQFCKMVKVTEGHEDHRIFWDQDYVASFERFNRALIEKRDLVKNLANLIREGVA